MGIEQKIRSLFCGLPGGIQFQQIDGQRFLPLTAVPFELERIIATWILALPVDDRMAVLYFRDGVPEGLLDEGWDAFVSWMLQMLVDAQSKPDFEEQAAALLHSRSRSES